MVMKMFRSWELAKEQQELNPNAYNPMDDPSPCIISLFHDLVQSHEPFWISLRSLPMVELQLLLLFLQEQLQLSVMDPMTTRGNLAPQPLSLLQTKIRELSARKVTIL